MLITFLNLWVSIIFQAIGLLRIVSLLGFLRNGLIFYSIDNGGFPLRQATGPPRTGAGVEIGMERGAGDSLT